jgi:hypothetical protein
MIDGVRLHVRRAFMRERPVQTAGTDLTVETTLSPHTSAASERRAGQLRYLVPITAFAGLMLTFVWALNRDPSTIPSALIGRQVPEFALPAVKGRTLGLSSADLIGEVSHPRAARSRCPAAARSRPRGASSLIALGKLSSSPSRRAAPATRNAKSKGVAGLPAGTRDGLRHHRGTANE